MKTFRDIITSIFSKIIPIGQYNAAPGSLSDTEWSGLQLDATKNLKVNIAGAAEGALGGAISTFDTGSKSAIGASALQLIVASVPTHFGVIIKAANGNTGTVYVGNADITAGSADATDGFELGAGESITLEVDNANKVYVIGSAAGQKVFFATV